MREKTITCKICGLKFKGHGLRTYCSDKCIREAKNRRCKIWEKNNPGYKSLMGFAESELMKQIQVAVSNSMQIM